MADASASPPAPIDGAPLPQGGSPRIEDGDPALGRVIEQVRAAASDARKLCIRGAGSKDFYGGAPQGEWLDVSALRGISRYEPTEMVITARAGTPLTEIEAALAEEGQTLGFEPPRFDGRATLGGAIASGLSGPARLSCGPARDFVLGAVMLNGRAELLRFGGQVMKNVAGYDVSRVLTGSLGILGVICEVSLKVLPRAPATRTLAFECPEAEAVQWVHQWMGRALPVHASVWQEGRLRVRLAGAKAAVLSAADWLAQEWGSTPVDPSQADSDWLALRDQTDPFFERAIAALHEPGAPRDLRLWRISMPPTQPPLELPGRTLVEWAGAQRWLLSDADDAAVRAKAARAGGHASIYRARERPVDFQSALPENLMQLHKSLKQAFDPKGIFNSGRMFSWL